MFLWKLCLLFYRDKYFDYNLPGCYLIKNINPIDLKTLVYDSNDALNHKFYFQIMNYGYAVKLNS